MRERGEGVGMIEISSYFLVCREGVRLREVFLEIVIRGFVGVKFCLVITLGKSELRRVIKYRVWN